MRDAVIDPTMVAGRVVSRKLMDTFTSGSNKAGNLGVISRGHYFPQLIALSKHIDRSAHASIAGQYRAVGIAWMTKSYSAKEGSLQASIECDTSNAERCRAVLLTQTQSQSVKFWDIAETSMKTSDARQVTALKEKLVLVCSCTSLSTLAPFYSRRLRRNGESSETVTGTCLAVPKHTHFAKF